jgi:hypothetical protein
VIAEAFLYAQQHDRSFTDLRIRNAYQGGDLAVPPGWTVNGREATVRLPGWSDPAALWHEDEYHVSTHAGNVAWGMLALLGYYEKTRRTDGRYLDAVQQLGEWIAMCCRDTRGSGGYRGGFAGRDQQPVALGYKSTEHNLDLYAAFQRLHLITGQAIWRDRADHARRFVQSMWDPAGGKFWSSTRPDGVNIERQVIPLDVQAWAILALRDDDRAYRRALEFVESDLKSSDGYDFNQDRDGAWYEGEAHLAAAYAVTRADVLWRTRIDALLSTQLPAGGLFAASRDGLTTGFDLPDGQPWLYYRRVHVAATAWLILAAARENPFWLGHREN